MTAARLTLGQSWLRQQIATLAAGEQTRPYSCGLNITDSYTEWLAGGATVSPSQRGPRGSLVLTTAAEAARLPTQAMQALSATLDRTTAALAVGLGPAAGHLTAVARVRGTIIPATPVTLVGPGWLRLSDTKPQAPPIPASDRLLTADAIWSRTIGALGERAWRHLSDLSVAVIGCGRSGSLITAALARLGIHRLLLVDADRMEPHNLGEMLGTSPTSVGHLKAEILQEAARSQSPWPDTTIEAAPASVLSLYALGGIKKADVLICAVDNPAARLFTACLAVFYLRPLLDLGTTILPATGTHPATLGADVRLVIPGRCLLDLGGIAGWRQARDDLLTHHDLTPATPDPEAWHRQRQGSLLSLNGLAVHLGLRLLEELIRGRLSESVWLRTDTTDGIPGLTRQIVPSPGACHLCRWTALGDTAVAHLPAVLAGLQ